MEFCAERGLSVGNTYFENRSLHKCTRVEKGQHGVEVKREIDMLHYVQDVGAVRRMGRGLSHHHVVLCKVRLVRAWIKRREVVVGRRRIRSEKLKEHQYRE